MQHAHTYTVLPKIGSSVLVEVEVDIVSGGVPHFSIVGMTDKSIDESKERINTALKNCGFREPKVDKTIVSLSPAHIRKEGTLFDLPIALAILLADSENTVDFDLGNCVFAGELSLSGTIRPIRGALAIAKCAQESGKSSVFLPRENASEASLIEGIDVYGVSSIGEILEHFDSSNSPEAESVLSPATFSEAKHAKPLLDFSVVVKQEHAKRALEIAAAGGHNIALYGPAGTGKTMLAQAFCSILPPLNRDQIIATTQIHSYAGVLKDPYISSPPLRAPHHTSSYVSVIGGGTYPRPGEVTLAHNGVLFLDEFPEFDARVLESLREPLEERIVRISRAKESVVFPADITLIAALNPPRAVYRSDHLVSVADERRFQKKISGPIMDRIDMWIQVPLIDPKHLLEDHEGESSAEIQKRVIQARARAHARGHLSNAHISSAEIKKLSLSEDARKTLEHAAKHFGFSPRVYHKIVKLSQTIADLAQEQTITNDHMLEALQYRPQEII